MNTNKTYVAFDAQGVYDHEHSNLHYYQQMREWQRQYPQRYAFLNMQDIDFSSMHEDLIDSTFKVRCLRQMAEADNLLVLASDLMNVESTTLNCPTIFPIKRALEISSSKYIVLAFNCVPSSRLVT